MMAVCDETREFENDLFYIDTVAHNKKRAIGILVFRNGDETAIFDSGMPKSAQNTVSTVEDFAIRDASIREVRDNESIRARVWEERIGRTRRTFFRQLRARISYKFHCRKPSRQMNLVVTGVLR